MFFVSLSLLKRPKGARQPVIHAILIENIIIPFKFEGVWKPNFLGSFETLRFGGYFVIFPFSEF